MACVIAHIKNQVLHGGAVVVLADQIVAARFIDPVDDPLSLSAALNYFTLAGVTLSPKPVAFMDQHAPAGHYAIFLRRPGAAGYSHVIHGEIREVADHRPVVTEAMPAVCGLTFGSRRKTMFDPQTDTCLPGLWADLTKLSWWGSPYHVTGVK